MEYQRARTFGKCEWEISGQVTPLRSLRRAENRICGLIGILDRIVSSQRSAKIDYSKQLNVEEARMAIQREVDTVLLLICSHAYPATISICSGVERPTRYLPLRRLQAQI